MTSPSSDSSSPGLDSSLPDALQVLPPLLPCPFCGHPPHLEANPPDPPELPDPWVSICCEAPYGCPASPMVAADSPAMAAVFWNTRAPFPPAFPSSITPAPYAN